MEVRKGSVYVRSKLWQAKRKGPGEKNKKKRVVSRFPAFTPRQLNKQESGRVFSSSSSRFPGDASPVRFPLFTLAGSNGSPRRGAWSEAAPPRSRPLGPLRPTSLARREAAAAAVTCPGSRQVRPLLRRGDSQMVRQEDLPPRPHSPALRGSGRLLASP